MPAIHKREVIVFALCEQARQAQLGQFLMEFEAAFGARAL